MLEIRKKLKVARGAYAIAAKGQVTLAFEQRRTRGAHAQLSSGEEVELHLPRGEVLQGGDLVVASDGRVIEVLAATERVLQVTFDNAQALAHAAYDLGSHHAAVEVGEGFLRLAADPALRALLEELGGRVEEMEAVFEPDAGAHAEGHAHEGHDHGHDHDHHDHDHHAHDHGHDHAGHDHGDHAHDHDHQHAHGHDHDHKHDHEHGKDHVHAHDHDHAHEHDHGHDHGKAHADEHDHGHEHDHEHEHGPDCGHDHGHDHQHKHGHDHKH